MEGSIEIFSWKFLMYRKRNFPQIYPGSMRLKFEDKIQLKMYWGPTIMLLLLKKKMKDCSFQIARLSKILPNAWRNS